MQKVASAPGPVPHVSQTVWCPVPGPVAGSLLSVSWESLRFTAELSGLIGQSWTGCPALWLLVTSESFVDICQDGSRALSQSGVDETLEPPSGEQERGHLTWAWLLGPAPALLPPAG